mgnify:CR=1 FL=1
MIRLKIKPTAVKGGSSWKTPMPLEAKVIGSLSCLARAKVLMVEVSAAMGML